MRLTIKVRTARAAAHVGVLGCVATLAVACGGATDTRAGAGGSPPLSAPDPQATGRDVLAVAVGTGVRLITIDGGQRSVLEGDPFFSGATGVDLVGGGQFLVARAYAEGSPGSGLRLALIKSNGGVEWTRPFSVSFAGGATDTALHWGISLGEDGLVVLDDRNQQSFHAASVGDSPGELPGYFPTGQSIGGFMPVRSAWSETDPYAVTFAWWRVGADAELVGVRQSTSTSGLDAAEPLSFGGNQLRLANHEGIVLLVEGALGTSEIRLPQATDTAHLEALANDEMFAADERWVLVGTGVADRVVRVDVQSKSTEVLNLVAPDGYRPFADCQENPTLESGLQIARDGVLVRAFRNDDQVAAFTSNDGVHWTQIGGSFSGVGGMEVSVTRGTYTVRGHRGVYCYSLGPTWRSTTNADFVGDWTQMVRVGAKARIASPAPAPLAYVLSRSGRYGARWDVDAVTHAATLLIADLETGGETTVLTDSTGIRSAEPAWLWEP